MRFQAPAREAVDPARFDHPVFAGCHRHRDLLLAPDWPSLDELNRRMASVDPGIGFVAQDRDLLADGLHYERRIAEQGQVATRPGNWHDLLNAQIWLSQPRIKRAINARQVADLGIAGPGQRTRDQCALTHFDEAGVIVVLREPSLLSAWDRHDWPALFLDHGARWQDAVDLVVIGHALLEHALWPDPALVGKCLVVVGAQPQQALQHAADAIACGRTLTDPQQLRPLPLAGIPGWHPLAGDADFYRQHPCFRPVRQGRRYPDPIVAEA